MKRNENKRFSYTSYVVGGVLILIVLLVAFFPSFYGENINQAGPQIKAESADAVKSSDKPETISSVAQYKEQPFPDTDEGKMVAYGKQIILETYKYVGPEGNSGNLVAGNRLACGSCHLNGGTKPYAAPYVGLTGLFPSYSKRDGRVATLEDRINGCFERSMNGKRLDNQSKEMIAMISYIKHLSKDVKIGSRIEGQQFVDVEIPNRKADLNHGELVYQKQCVSCHQASGEGLLKQANTPSKGYIYPPLWGDDSFNDGAGMSRIITATKFIKGNMPFGATAEKPLLTDEEAFDVAAYINSFERPHKANREKDYPILSNKPKDAAYPPFADGIPASQHKYGPFNF